MRELGADLAVADLHHVLVARVGLRVVGHISSSFFDAGVERGVAARRRARPGRRRTAPGRSIALRRRELLPLARDARLLLSVLVVAAHRVGDLGEVALRAAGGTIDVHARTTPCSPAVGSVPDCGFKPSFGELGAIAW